MTIIEQFRPELDSLKLTAPNQFRFCEAMLDALEHDSQRFWAQGVQYGLVITHAALFPWHGRKTLGVRIHFQATNTQETSRALLEKIDFTYTFFPQRSAQVNLRKMHHYLMVRAMRLQNVVVEQI